MFQEEAVIFDAIRGYLATFQIYRALTKASEKHIRKKAANLRCRRPKFSQNMSNMMKLKVKRLERLPRPKSFY